MLCARTGPRTAAVVGHCAVLRRSAAVHTVQRLRGMGLRVCGTGPSGDRSMHAAALRRAAAAQHMTQGSARPTDLPCNRAHSVVVEQRAVREHERVQFTADARV